MIAFWPQIVDFFSRVVIPWVEQNIAPDLASAIRKIIAFADGKIVPLRKVLKDSWRKFCSSVMGVKTTYTRVGANRIECETKMLTRNLNGKYSLSEVKQVAEWDTLPESVRSEMIRLNKKKASFDVHEAVCEKVTEEARKHDLLEVLEMEN
jgi:hypothetical protein